MPMMRAAIFIEPGRIVLEANGFPRSGRWMR